MNLVLQDAERSGIKASLRRPGCGSDRRRLILWPARNEQEQRISLRREAEPAEPKAASHAA